MSAPLCTVTPLEVRCEACNDTGSRYNSNFLDCTRCTAAVERSMFQSQIYSGEKMLIDDRLWRAYQLGKAAAAPVVPVAAQPAWKALSDVQWMNIVNHDHAYDQYSKDDAVHTAVKMTEAKCKELNAAPQPAASVTDVAKDAARLDFLEHCVMNHRCISAERDRDSMVGSPTYGDLPTVTIFTIPSQHKKGVGLRGAIDAAIAAQQGESDAIRN